MKLLSLRLRGAIGIREGLGLEEINIDFRQFSPGLIAIMGENGSGKTTTADNLHPYRLLKSRPGGLAREFYLKDSCRDLLMSFGDDEYRFLIEMNPTLKTPAIKSYVYKNGECLNPDGNESSYSPIVEKLCGDPDLFFSSVFMTQKRVPFSKVADAKSKELILELIGAARLQVKYEYANQQAKNLKGEIEKLEVEIGALESSGRPLAEIERDIEVMKGSLKDHLANSISLARKIEDHKTNLEQYQAQNMAQAVKKSERSQAQSRYETLSAEKRQAEATLDQKSRQLQIFIDGDETEANKLAPTCTEEEEAQADRMIAVADERKAEYLATVDDRQKFDALANELSQARYTLDVADRDYRSVLERLKANVLAAQNKLNETKTKVDFKRKELTDEIERKTRSTQILTTVPCQDESIPTECRESCKSCQFLKDATAAVGEITQLTQRLTDGEAAWTELSQSLTKEITDRQAAVDNHPSWDSIQAPLNEKIESIKKSIAELGFDELAANKAKTLHEECEKANYPERKRIILESRTKLETLNQRLTDNRTRLAELRTEQSTKIESLATEIEKLNSTIATLDKEIDIAIELRIRDTRAAINKAEIDKGNEDRAVATAEANIARLREDIKKASQSTENLGGLKAQLSIKQTDLADWEHLAQSLSRNGGFQSMLVESVGAEIAPFANELLALYGLPWTIEIATSKPTDDGKGVKDGFFVIVNKPSGSCELTKLSGGEEVWVDQVLFDSISHMLRRRSGLTLLTAFKDECDGSLDPQKAMEYLRAVEAAHVASRMNQTFVISHREEITQQIPQKIRFTKGKGITVEAA